MYSRTLLFLLSFLLSCGAFAQTVSYTYDARSDINQCKQYVTMLDNLQETLKQSEILEKAKNFLEVADKALSKVNSRLNEIAYVEMIVRRQVYLVRTYSAYISQVKGMKHISAYDVQRFEAALELFLSDSEKFLDMAEKILSDDWFKLDDGARIGQLKDIDENLSETQTAMDICYTDLDCNNQGETIRENLKSF